MLAIKDFFVEATLGVAAESIKGGAAGAAAEGRIAERSAKIAGRAALVIEAIFFIWDCYDQCNKTCKGYY